MRTPRINFEFHEKDKPCPGISFSATQDIDGKTLLISGSQPGDSQGSIDKFLGVHDFCMYKMKAKYQTTRRGGLVCKTTNQAQL